MEKKLFYIAILLTLLCCSEHPGEVRIKGKFAHLEQGEFLIYSPDGGLDRMDSLHIRDGRFVYDFPLESRTFIQIVYPNFSRLTIFANPGDNIKVEGDAQNLSEVKVSGTEDNEVYTRFRKEILGKSASEIHDLARQYILEHPTLNMSRYLFREHFLLADSTDTNDLREVYDSLCRANPGDVDWSRLSRAVRSYGLLRAGQPLPPFSLKVRPKKDSDKENPDLKKEDAQGKYLLIVFWAGWKSGSQSGLFRARTFRRKIKKEYPLSLISYSLDMEESELRRYEERDSIDYPSYCDFKCWRSPLVEQWGIRELPYFILADPDQKIIASGSDWMRDIEPQAQLLCL